MLAWESLGHLYASARLHGNLFQPSFKLREKRQEGARVIKRYHVPDNVRLRAMLADADPVLLMAGIRACQAELGKWVDERGMAAGRAETLAPLNLALFTASLKVAWEAGEQRPKHRRRYLRVKPIVRASMSDAVRDQLLACLEAQPALTAVAARTAGGASSRPVHGGPPSYSAAVYEGATADDGAGGSAGSVDRAGGSGTRRRAMAIRRGRKATRKVPVTFHHEATRRPSSGCRLTMVGAAAAPTALPLALASLGVGLGASVAPRLPAAAQLARPAAAGLVIGRLVACLLTAVLLV